MNKNSDYINEIIHHLNDQQKHMTYYISFNLGVIALTINGVLFRDNSIGMAFDLKIILLSSLVLILISTCFYDKWKEELYLLRIQATDLLYKDDIKEARRIHYPGNAHWKKHGWIYSVGVNCQRIGILGYVFFVIFLLF